ncbi:MAG: hypothetical protein ACRBHB_24940 [Arenicella sp.]
MHLSQQSVVVLRHVQFYLSYIYKAQLCLQDPECVRKFYKLVCTQDDWLLNSYWHDFVVAYNASATHKEKMALKRAIKAGSAQSKGSSSLAKYINSSLENVAKH